MNVKITFDISDPGEALKVLQSLGPASQENLTQKVYVDEAAYEVPRDQSQDVTCYEGKFKTLEDLQKKAGELIQSDQRDTVKAMLKAFNVKRIPEIDPTDYNTAYRMLCE